MEAQRAKWGSAPLCMGTHTAIGGLESIVLLSSPSDSALFLLPAGSMLFYSLLQERSTGGTA